MSKNASAIKRETGARKSLPQ